MANTLGYREPRRRPRQSHDPGGRVEHAASRPIACPGRQRPQDRTRHESALCRRASCGRRFAPPNAGTRCARRAEVAWPGSVRIVGGGVVARGLSVRTGLGTPTHPGYPVTLEPMATSACRRPRLALAAGGAGGGDGGPPMTPELREAIRLLRMSRRELIKAIYDELDALPLASS